MKILGSLSHRLALLALAVAVSIVAGAPAFALMAQRNPPDIRRLGAYDVNRQGQGEGIWAPLYDYGAPTADNYAAAGQTILNFFQVPQGQSNKTLADTNMENAGVLPAPKQFLCTGVQVLFFPSATLVARAGVAAAALDADFLRDVYTISKSGYLDFYIGSKSYLQDGPLGLFPSDARLAGWGTTNQTTTADANGAEQSYAAFAGPTYEISPLRLISQQNFKVSLNWPTAVALPSGVAARIGVRLLGFLYRLSQ